MTRQESRIENHVLMFIRRKQTDSNNLRAPWTGLGLEYEFLGYHFNLLVFRNHFRKLILENTHFLESIFWKTFSKIGKFSHFRVIFS